MRVPPAREFAQVNLRLIRRLWSTSRFPSALALNPRRLDPSHWVVRFGLLVGAPV